MLMYQVMFGRVSDDIWTFFFLKYIVERICSVIAHGCGRLCAATQIYEGTLRPIWLGPFEILHPKKGHRSIQVQVTVQPSPTNKLIVCV